MTKRQYNKIINKTSTENNRNTFLPTYKNGVQLDTEYYYISCFRKNCFYIRDKKNNNLIRRFTKDIQNGLVVAEYRQGDKNIENYAISEIYEGWEGKPLFEQFLNGKDW